MLSVSGALPKKSKLRERIYNNYLQHPRLLASKLQFSSAFSQQAELGRQIKSNA